MVIKSKKKTFFYENGERLENLKPEEILVLEEKHGNYKDSYKKNSDPFS